jgi:hypothetical protein
LRAVTRRRHDSLSKDLLSFWLEPLGRVETPRRVQSEERQIDLLFTAFPRGQTAAVDRRHLGLLGRMAQGVTALEAFRNPCTENEVRSGLVKLFELHADLLRKARRERRSAARVPLPHLWVLTPTVSEALLASFEARPHAELPAGFLATAQGLGTTLVVASLLPVTPETLWLRLLGRGQVQQQAIAELGRLPSDHPLRYETVVRVLRWHTEALQKPRPSEADRELIMNGARLLTQWENRVRREGEARGEAKGLRTAVVTACELLGIPLSPARQARLAAMGVDELEALRRALQEQRRWPRSSPKPHVRGVSAGRSR